MLLSFVVTAWKAILLLDVVVCTPCCIVQKMGLTENTQLTPVNVIINITPSMSQELFVLGLKIVNSESFIVN